MFTENVIKKKLVHSYKPWMLMLRWTMCKKTKFYNLQIKGKTKIEPACDSKTNGYKTMMYVSRKVCC